MGYRQNGPYEQIRYRDKSKTVTYVVSMVVLIGILVLANIVWKDPKSAQHGMRKLIGLPSGVLAAGLAVLGLIVFWIGLHMRSDWPEGLGALMVSGAIAWGEFVIGWKKFDVGGLLVVPYIIPLVVYPIMLTHAARHSE
jgi:hypothetical protein